MRELNDFEKKVLTRMAHRDNIQDVLVVSLLFEFCNVYVIGWDKEYKNLKVAFPNTSKSTFFRLDNKVRTHATLGHLK